MDITNAAPPCCESTVLQTGNSPRELAQRIFSETDWHYVAQEAAPIKRLFIQERRSLALQWLRFIRQQAEQVIYCHRAYTPEHPRRSIDRLRLFGNYLLLLSLCALLYLGIQWGNPIHSARLADWAVAIVERFSQFIPPPTSLNS
jgi:hypothetical protein